MSRPENAVGTWTTVEAKEWKVQEANYAGEGECESGGVAVVDVDGVENVFATINSLSYSRNQFE